MPFMKNAAPWKAAFSRLARIAQLAPQLLQAQSTLSGALGPLNFLNALFGVFLGQAIFLLQLAEEFVLLALEKGEIVVRKLAPGFLELALHLLEFSLGLILIHLSLLFPYYG